MAGRLGFNIMTVAHPYPPEAVRPGTDAWRAGLKEGGHDPAAHSCKLHLRVWVDEDGARAAEAAQEAIRRYDWVSGVGRQARWVPADYDWDAMLATGRNIYGTPDQCIELIRRAAANYDFDVCSTTFNFGGMPSDAVKRSMRLFAKEVIPALRT